MKLFTCKQIAEIDRLTMLFEPITSIDLMERASEQVANWMSQNIEKERKIFIFAGPGNNGGDALATARLLASRGYRCALWLARFGRQLSADAATNQQRLREQNIIEINLIEKEGDIPKIPEDSVVLEGLFGSGLNKPLSGLAKTLVGAINESHATVVSIDVPAGLFGEDNSGNDEEAIVQAHHTLTFQFPKLSFLFPENEKYVGEWKVLPIGLHAEAILQTESKFFSLTKTYLSGLMKKRQRFSHKGTYGHALLVAGSYGKMGASVLASKACLRSGVGLLTTHIPRSGCNILPTAVPEAMTSIDASETIFSETPETNHFSAIGIGPGLGKNAKTVSAFRKLLQQKPGKMVIDADALNILAENQELLALVPENAILTPHLKEFERLAGTFANSWKRLQLQISFSEKHRLIVVFKGAFTCITTPDGSVFFNSSGNPGMATAGSGDVLTGIILGLLSQNHSQEEAALLGVYLHGLSGDHAAARLGQHSLIAGDIIEHLGEAFLQLE